MTETLGKYRLVRLLATGGMAEVYLARQAGAAGFEKQVCLKRILPHLGRDQRFIAMFLDEARLASRLDHPNIVSIFDLGEANGSYFIAMEYIDGPTLRAVAQYAAERGEPLPVAEVLRIAAQAAGGLHYAHELRAPDGRTLGLVHRDVSPDNVMVHRNGTVKIVDFGIAKAAGTRGATRTGTLKGKVAYMAPEALRGEAIDRRADVFALGVVLYELLAGQRPWDAPTEVALISRILNDEPRPLPELRADVPQELWTIVARALAKDPAERIQTCLELQGELERHLVAWGEAATSSRLGQFIAACAPTAPPPAAEPQPPKAAARPRTPGEIDLSTPARKPGPTPADRPARTKPAGPRARLLQQEFSDEVRVPQGGRPGAPPRRRSRVGLWAALGSVAGVAAVALIGASWAAGGSGGALAGYDRLAAEARRMGILGAKPAAVSASESRPKAPASAEPSDGAVSAPAADAKGATGSVAPAGATSASSLAGPAAGATIPAGAASLAATPASSGGAATATPAPSAGAATATPAAAGGANATPGAPVGAPAAGSAAASPQDAASALGVAQAAAGAPARATDPVDAGAPPAAPAASSATGPEVAGLAAGSPGDRAAQGSSADGGVQIGAAPGASPAARAETSSAPAARTGTPAAPPAALRAVAPQPARKPRRQREEDRLAALASVATDGPPEPVPAADATSSDAEAAPAAAAPTQAGRADSSKPQAAPAEAASAAAAPAGKGELLVLVRPWARVEVDGKAVGDTPLSAPLELTAGDHEVRLVNPELGKDVTRTVHVRASERAVLKERLDE